MTKELALCWIHDGRHYKKLRPVIPHHQKLLEGFLEKYWEYYRKLIEYKINPSQSLMIKLSKEFDQLFLTKTNFNDLDDRIEKTKKKKKELLLVLKYPQLPLHNNESELGARVQARKRDVSFQTRSEEGTKANDTFMTIVQTAKKQGVNVYQYIFDRVSKKYEMISLADLIKNKNPPFQQLVA